MLLSLLLLAQLLFMPAQEQVISASVPPVEVLEAEVLTHELRPRTGGNPRNVQPPGAVGSKQFPGVRETIIREQPTIEERSNELGKVARRPASQAVRTRSEGGYIYEYRVRVKNTSPKKIKSITWEYQLTDGSGTTTVSQRAFLCATTIKSGSVKLLAARTPSPPNRVVSTSDEEHQQKALVNRIEFSDGSTWSRDGWKQEADAATKARDLRDGQCTML